MAFPRMLFPDGLNKALTFSYDDAVQQDERLASILSSHGMKGTFNINTGSFAPEGAVFEPGRVHRRLTEAQTVALFSGSEHEVALHTLTHPFLERLPVACAVEEVIGDRRNIERLFGTVTRGMAYPFGTYNDEVVDVLAKCGICYSRTTASSRNFDIPTDWLRLRPTCHHNDDAIASLTDKFLGENTSLEPWLFYVWGHSYEFERDDNWEHIEALADRLAGQSDVWYATNIEIYDYITAWRSLRFGVEAARVQNPTALPLWLLVRGEKLCVEPGKTLVLK